MVDGVKEIYTYNNYKKIPDTRFLGRSRGLFLVPLPVWEKILGENLPQRYSNTHGAAPGAELANMGASHALVLSQENLTYCTPKRWFVIKQGLI